METKNLNILKSKIQLAYKNQQYNFPTNGTLLEKSLKVYKKIKEFERSDWDWENNEKTVNYKKELEEAKDDLYVIFSMPLEEIKKMTKNNLYMTHQSLMVNSIYELFEKGEL